MPGVRVLDFQKVVLKERVEAKNLFSGEKGLQLIEDLKNKKFSIEDNEEYLKGVNEVLQNEAKKKKLYVFILY